MKSYIAAALLIILFLIGCVGVIDQISTPVSVVATSTTISNTNVPSVIASNAVTNTPELFTQIYLTITLTASVEPSATPTETPIPFHTPTPIVPANEPLGTLIFQRDTNIRTCESALSGMPSTDIDYVYNWFQTMNIAQQCPIIVNVHEPDATYFKAGQIARVWVFVRTDASNVWAWFSKLPTYTSVACYNGIAQALFYSRWYPTPDVGQPVDMTDAPAAINPCKEY